MLIVERKLPPFSYKSAYFAAQSDLDRIIQNIRLTEIVRCFYTAGQLNESRTVLNRQSAFTVCNDLTQPLAELWAGFTPHTRGAIRKAERLGDRIRIVRDGTIPDFLAVYNRFAQEKDGVAPISAQILKRYESMADRLILYLDQKPAVVNLVIRDPVSSRVRGLYNASMRLASDEGRETRLMGNLNRFLHWHNMQLYKHEDFKTYDWGGVSPDLSDGRSHFKLSFGGKVIEESIYLCAGSLRLGLMAGRLLRLL